MPTENRSTMVSVPRELAERIQQRLNHAATAFKAAKPERDQLRAILAQPAKRQGEPILLEAVAVTREDDDGLYLDWLIEGGIAAMEHPGVALLVAPEHPKLCEKDGSAQVWTGTDPGEVERDELLEFEEWWHTTKCGERSPFAAASSAWQARAALGRKPEVR